MAKNGAAGIIIGNEVLSAKVVDANGVHLVQRLHERSIPLRSLAFVPDEVDAIVEAVALARRRARWVVTSGGIGPTHDDITVRAVALALGRAVTRDPGLEREVKQHYGPRATPEALRLADLPQGAELIRPPGFWFPVLGCDGVFMLPGVPSFFRAQLDLVLDRMEGQPGVLRCLYVSAGEPEIANAVDRVALAMPHVSIGSYPTFEPDADYRVKITVEHAEPAPVEEAVAQLTRELAASLLRVE